MTGATSRRGVLSGAVLAFLAACSAKPSANKDTASAQPQGSLAWAVAGPWRPAADRRLDGALHPDQTLKFFGLRPGMTVVDVWPGAGWWTGVLAPYLNANKGRLYAATFEVPNPDDPAAAPVVEAYKRMIAGKPEVYGPVVFTTFGPHSAALAPSSSADLVLFFHVDSWMAAGLAEKAFRDAFAALRPGGTLGVVQARGEPGGVQDPLATSGYVQEAFVKQLAAEAGFKLDAASEINANPDDKRGRKIMPFAKTAEPDRMTLRFVKPN